MAVRPRVPHELLLAFGGWQEGIPSTMMESYDIRTNLWFDTKLSNKSPRAYHGIEVTKYKPIIRLNSFNLIEGNRWYDLCDRRYKWNPNTGYRSVF